MSRDMEEDKPIIKPRIINFIVPFVERNYVKHFSLVFQER
jgi:hypothetical protein